MAVPPPRRVPRRAPGQRTGSAPRSRSPRDGNDDEDISFAPRRKTVKMNPAVAIALFASPVVLALIIGVLYYNQENSTTGVGRVANGSAPSATHCRGWQPCYTLSGMSRVHQSAGHT